LAWSAHWSLYSCISVGDADRTIVLTRSRASLRVAGTALVSFGTAKILHDVTGFLERPDVVPAASSTRD